MATYQANASDYIDYDLQLEDYSKITVAICDLLRPRGHTLPNEYLCEIFNESECHHTPNHHLDLSSLTTKQCRFCKFAGQLRTKHALVNIIQNKTNNSLNTEKQLIPVRYRNIQSKEILEWCDFQPWRAPYILYGFASCQNKEEILTALENFEVLKTQHKKTLITSKLFIDMLATEDEFLNVQLKSLNINPYNISRLNIDDEIKKSNFIIEKNLSSFNFNTNSSIFQFDLESSSEMKNPKLLNRNASIFQNGKVNDLLNSSALLKSSN